MYSSIIQQYQPSLALGIIGVVLTVLFTCHHIFLYFRLRAWFFYLIIACTILEMIAFITQLIWTATNGQLPLTLYISYMVMTFTPSLLAAACHMTFGRVLSCTMPPLQQRSITFILPASAIAPLFVCLDLVALCFYILGSTLICAAQDTTISTANLLSTGLRILKWNYTIQVAYLGLFVITTIRFFTLKRIWQPVKVTKTIVLALTSVICISSTLIMLRGVYQLIQIQAAITNRGTYSWRNEWVFWVVDALPIFIIFLSFAIVHPGKCLPSSFTSFSVCATPTVLHASLDPNDQTQPILLMHPTSHKPLPPLPNAVISNRSLNTRKPSLLKKLAKGTWPSTSNRSRGYDEVSPYESVRSYSAFMHGAL